MPTSKSQLSFATRKKLDFLQKYINKSASLWFCKYGNQITGVWVDKKKIGRKTTRFYSIVFNVIQKKKEHDLNPKQIIPKSILVKFPDGQVKSIKTDVKQTGEIHFHIRIMDPVKDGPESTPGTLGLILRDNQQNFFGLTNYHVAAQELLGNNIRFYDAAAGHPRHDVNVGGIMGRLDYGGFNQDIDAAIVNISYATSLSNRLPDGTTVDNTDFVRGRLNASIRGKRVKLYLPSRGGRIILPIRAHEYPLNHRLVQFRELITVNRCTEGGDSGSIVVMENNYALGIVVAGDDHFTYIVPYYKIHNFFRLSIL